MKRIREKSLKKRGEYGRIRIETKGRRSALEHKTKVAEDLELTEAQARYDAALKECLPFFHSLTIFSTLPRVGIQCFSLCQREQRKAPGRNLRFQFQRRSTLYEARLRATGLHALVGAVQPHTAASRILKQIP